MNQVQKIISVFKEIIEEMRYKVTWLKYKELQSSSILVIVGTLIFSLTTWVIDFVFQNGLTFFYNNLF